MVEVSRAEFLRPWAESKFSHQRTQLSCHSSTPGTTTMTLDATSDVKLRLLS